MTIKTPIGIFETEGMLGIRIYAVREEPEEYYLAIVRQTGIPVNITDYISKSDAEKALRIIANCIRTSRKYLDISTEKGE